MQHELNILCWFVQQILELESTKKIMLKKISKSILALKLIRQDFNNALQTKHFVLICPTNPRIRVNQKIMLKKQINPF